MWVHYTKLALKVLWRRKVFTGISLFGISFTLVVLMVLAAMIDHLLAPMAPETQLGRTLHASYISLEGEKYRLRGAAGYGLLDGYLRDLPGVERMGIVSEPASVNSFVEGRKVVSQLRYADGEYWKIMEFEFLEGAPFGVEDERSGNHVAVISASTRQKYFGAEPCLGKMLEAGGIRYRVVGVVENVPAYRFAAFGDIWVPVSTNRDPNFRDELRGGFVGIFLAGGRGDFDTIRDAFQARLATVQLPEERLDRVRGTPMTRLEEIARAQGGSDMDSPVVAQLLAGVGLGVLLFMLLPTINLINLNVSRIFERSSEIGVRKAFGASSGNLVGQFVFENIVLCLVGGIIGIVGSIFLLRAINGSGLIAHAEFGLNLRVFAYALGLAIIFGCMSGVYPAWRMARMNPVAALRGETR
jgi:putative ABC transport system permease protein